MEEININTIINKRLRSKWNEMKRRCNDAKGKYFKHYKNRGIKCEWSGFEEFKNDMYKSFVLHVIEFGFPNTTLERTDNNRGYSKENCRWATWAEQASNKRPYRSKIRGHQLIAALGETRTASQWAKILKIDSHVLWEKLYSKEYKTFDDAIAAIKLST